MNERGNAIESHRLGNHASLWLLVACVCLSGCALANDTSRVFFMAKRTTHIEPRFYRYLRSDRMAQREARKLGQQAWAEYASSTESRDLTADFENGFVEGFADYLYRGGSGEPPVVPPRGYWNLRFLNHYGRASTKAWYEGFRTGANDCKARGLRELWVIPTSLYAEEEPHATGETTSVLPTDPDHWNTEQFTDELDLPSRQSVTRPAGRDAPKIELDGDEPSLPKNPTIVPTDAGPVIEGIEAGEELRLDDYLSIRAVQPATRIPVTIPAAQHEPTAHNAAEVDRVAGILLASQPPAASPSPEPAVAPEEFLFDPAEENLETATLAETPAPLPTQPRSASSKPAPMKLVFEPPVPAPAPQKGPLEPPVPSTDQSPEHDASSARQIQPAPQLPASSQTQPAAASISDMRHELPMRVQSWDGPAVRATEMGHGEETVAPKTLNELLNSTEDALQLPRIVHPAEQPNRSSSASKTNATPAIRWRIRD